MVRRSPQLAAPPCIAGSGLPTTFVLFAPPEQAAGLLAGLTAAGQRPLLVVDEALCSAGVERCAGRGVEANCFQAATLGRGGAKWPPEEVEGSVAAVGRGGMWGRSA
eukprot:15437078-Alexandrium_andersonii.AAC.1